MKFLDICLFTFALYRLYRLVDDLDDLKAAPVFLKDEAAPKIALDIVLMITPIVIIVLRVHGVL